MRSAVALALLTLAACGPRAPAPEPIPTGPNIAPGQILDLACDVFAGATLDSLTQQYGEANIVHAVLPGVEGETFEATLIFPDDPGRRIEIHWRDAATHTQISEVSISGEQSDWRGPNGLALGQTIDEVEAANGKPFELFGFGWDYGGTVSDWDGGDFAPRGDCIIRAQFFAPTEDTSVMGDRPLRSDAANVRAAGARISQIGLGFRPAR